MDCKTTWDTLGYNLVKNCEVYVNFTEVGHEHTTADVNAYGVRHNTAIKLDDTADCASATGMAIWHYSN